MWIRYSFKPHHFKEAQRVSTTIVKKSLEIVKKSLEKKKNKKKQKKKKKKTPLLFSDNVKHGVFEIDMLSLFLLFTKIDTNPCDPNPCGDSTGVHGTCSELTTTDFKCDCDHRYIGATCTGKSIILIH